MVDTTRAGTSEQTLHPVRALAPVAAVIVAGLAGLVGLVGLVGLAGLAGPAGADEDDEIVHVALGDSYSSGQGAGDHEAESEAPWRGGDGCYRSERAYPNGLLDAAGLEGTTELVACGGATAQDLAAAAEDPDAAPDWAVAQLEALDEDTDLVTLTIGGNDAGFAEVLTVCHAVDRCDELFAQLAPGDEDLVTQRIAASFHPTVTALAGVREHAPNAAVVLVEYPRLFDPDATASDVRLAPEELAWLNERNDQLNAMLADAAATAGVTFADGVADAFAGHEVGTEDPWIRGADLASLPASGTAEWFHPTADGHEAIRDVVADYLADGVPANPEADDRADDYPRTPTSPTIAPLRWNDGALPVQARPGERLAGTVSAEPISAGGTYDLTLEPGGRALATGVKATADGALAVDAEVPEEAREGVGALVVRGSGPQGDPLLLAAPAVIGDLPAPLPATIDRLAGPDRIATAAAIAADAFPDGSGVAVLASAAEPADALAGGPLAVTLGAPLLLTEPGELPEATTTTLDRLGASEVWIVGGSAAVNDDVADDLSDAGVDTERVGGDDRYATAAAVAEQIALVTDQAGGRAFVAASETALPGTGWPDAVSVGAYAGASGAPVLLTTPDEVPEPTAAALAGVENAVIAGGPLVVSQDVAAEITGIVGNEPERLAGLTRYGTSSAVARAAVDAGVLDPAEVWVATGRDWADALAAGPAAARGGASLVLVDGSSLAASLTTVSWLGRPDTATDRLVLVGGPAAVDEAIVGQVAD